MVDYLPLKDLKFLPQMQGTNTFFTALPDWFALDALADIQLEHGCPEWLQETRLMLRIAKPFAAMLGCAPLRHAGIRSLVRSLAVCDVGRLRHDVNNPSYDIGWDSRPLCNDVPQLQVLKFNFALGPFEGPELEEFKMHKDLGVHSLRRLLGACRNMADQASVMLSKYGSGNEVGETIASLSSLHDIMACVQAKVDDLSLLDQGQCPLRSRNTKYATLQSIHAFCLSQELKNDSHLRAVCQWALRLSLPESLADEYVQTLCKEDSSIRMPSAATMSRLRARVDVAWTLTFREKVKELIAEGFTAYLTWDASPQGGKELEMFVWNFVKETVLPQMQVDITWLELRCLE